MKNQTNIEKYKNLTDLINMVDDKVDELKSNKKTLELERRKVIKEIFSKNKSELENIIFNWININPIETLSIIWASKYGSDDIFLKSDNDYYELFGDDDSTGEVYELINKNTLASFKFTSEDLYSHFSSMNCEDAKTLKFDFMDNHFNLSMLKETGYFMDECHWEINYIVGDDVDILYDILLDNFTVINYSEFNNDEKNIHFSRENIEDIIKNHNTELDFSEHSFAILDNNTVIGLIEYHLADTYICLDSIEIFDEFKHKKYATKTISKLQIILELSIAGYCMQHGRDYEFLKSLGAEFDDYKDCHCCDNYENCDDINKCDKAPEYSFNLEY